MALIEEELLNKYPLEQTEITDYITTVKGTTFRVKEDGLDLSIVHDGDIVMIQAELGNQYDQYACRVMHNETGKHIGYIPKEISEEVWKQSMSGDLYIGKVYRRGSGKIVGLELGMKRLHRIS